VKVRVPLEQLGSDFELATEMPEAVRTYNNSEYFALHLKFQKL
jgi:hypothetical protein